MTGQAPVAYVVLADGYEASAAVTGEEVRESTLDHVATYTHPRRAVFVDQLPRSGTRKVQRFKLEEQFGTLSSSEEL